MNMDSKYCNQPWRISITRTLISGTGCYRIRKNSKIVLIFLNLVIKSIEDCKVTVKAEGKTDLSFLDKLRAEI